MHCGFESASIFEAISTAQRLGHPDQIWSDQQGWNNGKLSLNLLHPTREGAG